MGKQEEMILSGLRQDEWVNPFGASPEELLAGALDESGLMDKKTTINGKPARKLFETFSQKRVRFQEATRLGSILVRQDVLSQEQLALALQSQQKNAQPLGKILLELKICTQEDIDAALTRQAEIREEFQRMEMAERERRGLWNKVVGFLADDGKKRLRD